MDSHVEIIEKVVDFFESKELDRLVKMVRFVTTKLEEDLAERAILARVSSRVKSSHSLRGKLEKWAGDPNKAINLLGSPQEVLNRVSDLAAARVMTYTENDREAVSEMAKFSFSSPGSYRNSFDLEKKEDHPRIKNDPDNHYRATHMMVAVHEADLHGEFTNLKHDKCELQITSLLAHVWNEIEHDTIYKTLSGDLSDLERDAIDSLGHLTKTGDNIIKSLLRARDFREDREEGNLLEENARFSHFGELSNFLENHYGQKINGAIIDYFSGVAELMSCLQALNWHHPRDVAGQLSPKFLQEARKETLSLKRFLERNKRLRPTLDVDSCDLLVVGAMMKRQGDLETKFASLHKNKREVAILSLLIEKNA